MTPSEQSKEPTQECNCGSLFTDNEAVVGNESAYCSDFCRDINEKGHYGPDGDSKKK